MPLALEVGLHWRHPDEFNRMLEDAQRPDSPHYKHPLTETEVNKYGPAPSDYEAAERWFRSEGFKIGKVYGPLVNVICAYGNAAQVETAMKVQIVQSADGKLFGNTSLPQFPSNVAAIVASVGGLSNLTNYLSGPRILSPCQFTEGAASAEIYDPVAGSFTLTGSLSTARNSNFDFAIK